MIEPLQGSLAQQIYKEHVFYIEDAIGSGEKFARDPQEFSHPVSREPAFDDEKRTIFVFWNRDSQHNIPIARASPYVKSRASCSVFKEKRRREGAWKRGEYNAIAAHAAIAACALIQGCNRGE
jgi:hypothetical protein